MKQNQSSVAALTLLCFVLGGAMLLPTSAYSINAASNVHSVLQQTPSQLYLHHLGTIQESYPGEGNWRWNDRYEAIPDDPLVAVITHFIQRPDATCAGDVVVTTGEDRLPWHPIIWMLSSDQTPDYKCVGATAANGPTGNAVCVDAFDQFFDFAPSQVDIDYTLHWQTWGSSYTSSYPDCPNGKCEGLYLSSQIGWGHLCNSTVIGEAWSVHWGGPPTVTPSPTGPTPTPSTTPTQTPTPTPTLPTCGTPGLEGFAAENEAQAFDSPADETSLLSPECQPQPTPTLTPTITPTLDPQGCIIKVTADEINAYDNPVIALTQKKLYPGNPQPTIPYDGQNAQVFVQDVQFKVSGYYKYPYADGTPFEDIEIYQIDAFSLDPDIPDEYHPESDPWESTSPLWIYHAGSTSVITPGLCDKDVHVMGKEYENPLPRYQTIEQLREFGIEVKNNGGNWPGHWDDTELASMLNGVSKTASPLAGQSAGSDTPREAFYNVMVEGDNPEYILFVRVFEGPGECVTNNSAIPRQVTCSGKVLDQPASNWYPQQKVTEWLVVHELGHIFDGRSDRALSGYVDDVSLGNTGTVDYTIYDEDGLVLMRGYRSVRGWGSGPTYVTSMFQQDSIDAPLEIAPDMFLNWVYREYYGRNHENAGFKDRSWSPDDLDPNDPQQLRTCNQVIEGCPDPTNPGHALYLKMGEWMTAIFTEKVWN